MNKLLLLNIIFWIIVVISIIYIVYNYYKNSYIKEGFGIEDFGSIFGIIPDIFNKVANIFTSIGKVFDYVKKIIMCYIPGVAEWLGDHLKCAISKIQSLFDCFIYYAIEIFGKVIYFPIMLIFYFSNSTDVENAIWNSIERLDRKIYKSTGYHICHYSDSVQNKCYKCSVRKLVHAPKWPF
jgi:predicted PurR-regulated permease PerM